ncbi:hypothetical protein ABEF95_015941 [Exophiala dermatitidis]
MDTLKIFGRQITDGTFNGSNSDNNDGGVYDTDYYWWYSPTAYAIKWAVIATLLVALALYLIGGYLHAKRRMRKGLPPLAYHRWLVSRRQRMAFAHQHPQYANQFSFYRNQNTPYGYGQGRQTPYAYGHGQAYPMGAYGPPPPAYGEPDYVPAYTPPAGNKVDPDQNYAPPSGPPPSNDAAGASSGPPPPPTDGPSQPPRAHFVG